MSEWNKDFPRTMHWAYICDRCHTYDIVDVTYTFKNTLTPETLFTNHNTLGYACPVCKDYTRHYMVDADIAKSVSIMNKLGYKTAFSCQGHCKTIFIKDSDDSRHIRSHLNEPYIFVKGKKKPDPELIEVLIKAGFDDWDIGQNITHRQLDISKVDDVIELLNTGVFCFHYGYDKIDKKVKRVRETVMMPCIIDEHMKKYFEEINKKLSDTLEEYYIRRNQNECK